MEIVKTEGDITIIKKRSGRFGVQGKNKKWINGDEKTKILADAGLIKISVKQEAPVEEAPAEETAEAAAEEATIDSSAE
ncbi:MAG: hypothetical protein N4A33_12090 [Bacteriovoracaceae bacterium]|jgi:hypothetical protein|nr:hypothetical protein [Bacteriovoracaceae bacterium]